ncbi:MAG: lipopolysaccharide assembly protein LapB, partial [Betaproteobacteria bacterium]|nr:lipopolysaccharide assembly protein LapB [Betaproteobacteria bacterium]
MEFDFRWAVLLCALFFALGWMAARIDIKQLVTESRALPRTYFRGLNFLLNEQPDKAIEAFIEVVKVDPQTVELHFALGNLFRRRGEVERAIRMHQNLVDRDDLAPDQRVHAIFELGQDFLKAGLLDRSEQCFLKLKGTSFEPQAREMLLEIYEKEKDWGKAIEVAQARAGQNDQTDLRQVAQFHCELAQQDMTHSRFDEARAHLVEALAANRKCARANLLLGDLEANAGNPQAAVAAWKLIEGQDPRYLALIAQRLLAAFKQLGQGDAGVALLKGYLTAYPSLDLFNAVYQSVLDTEGAARAQEFVREELKRNPTLMGLDKFLESQLLEAPLERRRDLEMIRTLMHQHTRGLSLYRCDTCGFKARQYYWHCPACGGWETYPPRR